MNKLKYIVLLIALPFFYSCKKTLSKEELRTYILDPENGLCREKTISGLKFQLVYFPASLSQSYNSNSKNSGTSDYDYFILKIKSGQQNRSPLKTRSKSEKEYMNRLYYAQTQMKNDFIVRCGEKKYPCLSLEYEDDHNLAGEMKVIIAFRKMHSENDIVIEYEDNLFGQGIINFKFNNRTLTNIPDLKI